MFNVARKLLLWVVLEFNSIDMHLSMLGGGFEMRDIHGQYYYELNQIRYAIEWRCLIHVQLFIAFALWRMRTIIIDFSSTQCQMYET